MTYYVLTFHSLNLDGSYGPMYGTPMVFTSRETAVEHGRTRVDYRQTDFKVNRAEVLS